MIEKTKDFISEFTERVIGDLEKPFDVLDVAESLLEELTKMIDDIDCDEREKYEPCYMLISPISQILSHKKLWRINRAVFRPSFAVDCKKKYIISGKVNKYYEKLQRKNEPIPFVKRKI